MTSSAVGRADFGADAFVDLDVHRQHLLSPNP